MSSIRWAPQAADDLQAIRDFIGRDSPRYAAMVIERIMAAVDILERFPLAGRQVPNIRGKIFASSFDCPIESSTGLLETACIS